MVNRFLIATILSLPVPLLAGTSIEDPKDGKEIAVQQEPKPVSQDEWHFSFTPYFWLPTSDLTISVPEVTAGNHTIGGDISIYEPWWEVLSKFSSDFYVLALMGRVEAWKGRWGGFLDGYWATMWMARSRSEHQRTWAKSDRQSISVAAKAGLSSSQ